MPGRRGFLGLVVVVSVLIAGSAGASQAIAWTAPVGVSPLDKSTNLIGTDIDAAGNSTTAWQVTDVSPRRIQARVRRSDGSLGFIRNIGEGGFARFAMDDAGNSYFVWVGSDGTDDRIYYRSLSATGALGPTVALSPAGADASFPGFAIDPAGNAVVSWVVLKRVQMRTVSSSGVLGTRQTVSGQPRFPNGPEVAMNAAGDATIVWGSEDGTVAVQVPSGGAPGPVKLLSGTGAQVVMNADGDAIVLSDDDPYLQVQTLTAGGSVEAPIRVGLLKFGDYTLAIDGSGTSLIVWAPEIHGNERVRDRTLSPAGVLGPMQLLSSLHGRTPDLGLNSAGDAVIAWQEDAPGSEQSQTQAIERAADGSLGPEQTISGTARTSDPMVGLNDGGEAIAAWHTRRIQVSAGP